MKTITTLLFVSIIFLFASCGSEDNLTNSPGTNGNTALFSKDTFMVYLPIAGIATIKDSLFFNYAESNVNSINIAFDISTNIGVNSEAEYNVKAFQSDSTVFQHGTVYSQSPIDTSLSLNINLPAASQFKCGFYLRVYEGFTIAGKYLKMKNIKITKLS